MASYNGYSKEDLDIIISNAQKAKSALNDMDQSINFSAAKRRGSADNSKSPLSAQQTMHFPSLSNKKGRKNRREFCAVYLLLMLAAISLIPRGKIFWDKLEQSDFARRSFEASPPKLVYCDDEYEFQLIIDAFENAGYRRTTNQSKALFIYNYATRIDKTALQRWQRPNLFPGSWVFATKTKVLTGLKEHNLQLSQQSPKTQLPFLMETYVLGVRNDREALLSKFQNEGGMETAWVRKQPGIGGGGKGVSSLSPNSQELKELKKGIENYDHSSMRRIIIQKMMSNLLLHRGRKFHIRALFFIASVDPLVMFYHDGFLIISPKKFDANDFSKSNLVDNLHFFERWEGFGNLTKEEKESRAVTFEDFVNDDLLKYTKENPDLSNINDPGEHLRSQMKSALATTMGIFRPYFSKSASKRGFPTDNAYALIGVDFFVSDELCVKLIEVNTMPTVDNRTEAQRRVYPPMFSGMVEMISDVHQKQQKGKKVLPIEPKGGWELIFTDDYQFKYDFDM